MEENWYIVVRHQSKSKLNKLGSVYHDSLAPTTMQFLLLTSWHTPLRCLLLLLAPHLCTFVAQRCGAVIKYESTLTLKMYLTIMTLLNGFDECLCDFIFVELISFSLCAHELCYLIEPWCSLNGLIDASLMCRISYTIQ